MAITGDEDTGLSTPIQAYIKYFNRIKPYHTKILEVLEQYNFSDIVSPSFFENVDVIVQKVTPTITTTITPSVTISITPSYTTTITPTVTPSKTPAISGTPSPTDTPLITPSSTATPTPSPTVTVTPSPTLGVSPTATPTNTVTPSPTVSPTVTVSPSPTAGASATPTPTATATATATVTPTKTPTVTPSNTVTATSTATPTATPTPTVTPSATPGAVVMSDISRTIQLPPFVPLSFTMLFGPDGRLGEIFNNAPSVGQPIWSPGEWWSLEPETDIGDNYEIRMTILNIDDPDIVQTGGGNNLVWYTVGELETAWVFECDEPFVHAPTPNLQVKYEIRDKATETIQDSMILNLSFLAP